MVDACAHGQSPCASCQYARVTALVAALARERIEALREIKVRYTRNDPPNAILTLVNDALDGIPRDTRLDAATTLVAKCHTALRRSKTPRPAPDLMQELVAFLAGQGIAVSDD